MTPMPTEFGERLLTAVVDEIAVSDPDRILYSFAKTNNPADGFQDITAKAFARAVDRCAWYIESNLGPGKDFPTVAYIGPQNIVYGILVLACNKAGYKVLLNSPRNTLDAHLNLFDSTKCNTFFLPPNFPLPVVKQILAARAMQVVEIAGPEHWISDEPVEPFPYFKTFPEAKMDPFVVLHTSGSTGLPKPIVQTHGTMSPLDAFNVLPSLGLSPSYPAMCAGTRVYLAFPLFHCAGISMLLPAAIYNNCTIVLAAFPPSADIANAVHLYGNVQHSCLAPMTLIDLVKDPIHLENLAKLQQITYGGGACPRDVGDLVSRKTRLVNCLGTTECGPLPVQLCDPEDWAYMSVSPVLGHEYRHVSGDLYEQVIVRDPKLERYQGIFGTFPDLTEWPMKDLYSKHPSKEDVWLYRGRADDIIVFSTGEKLNPIEMEGLISANPNISGALITGNGRFQSSLLVEAIKAPENKDERDRLLNEIWPSIEASNKESPTHGRIHRHMVVFTAAGKPMLRAGKGTVQRRMTVDLYSKELDELYSANEASVNGHSGHAKDEYTPAYANGGGIHEFVLATIALSTDLPVNSLAPDSNFFDLGLDSLQVTVMARSINGFLSSQGARESVGPRNIYANPSLGSLVPFLSALIDGTTISEIAENDEQKMQRLYKTYSSDLPLSARKVEPRSAADGSVVLLAGSTGSLGSYILDTLLGDPGISRIYCLNRGPNSLARQQNSLASKGLRPLSGKVELFDIDLSLPYFGLSLELYRKLLNEVTTIIHNSWSVDFNLSIDSYDRHLAAVRRFIDFSAHSRFGAAIFFISSISAVSNRGRIHGDSSEILEQIYSDWRVSQGNGYGESKLVAEVLLETAAKSAEIPASVCRVGQIAGPTAAAGVWPKQEWLPSLIASSKFLRKLPSTLGQMESVDWIPVDILARVIVELAFGSSSSPVSGAAVYHTLNPQRTTWSNFVQTVKTALSTADGSPDIEIVSLAAWVDALRESMLTTVDITQNPAIKLIDFFQEIVSNEDRPVVLDIKNTLAASNTLANLDAVHEAWVENWIRQWAF